MFKLLSNTVAIISGMALTLVGTFVVAHLIVSAYGFNPYNWQTAIIYSGVLVCGTFALSKMLSQK
jgi:hypothetical protein